MATSHGSCRVLGCNKKHKRHFCNLCEERDATHFRSVCPKGERLYHGTHIRAVKPIATKGLNTTIGQLGEGIYFVETYEEAKSISYFRQDKNEDIELVLCVTAVIECQVYLGRHTNLDGPSKNRTWHLEYASASNLHGPWAGIDYHFKEYCLKNKDRCLVTAVYLNDVRIERFPNTRWPKHGWNAIIMLCPDATIGQVKNALRRIDALSLGTPASPKAKLKKKKIKSKSKSMSGTRSISPKRNNDFAACSRGMPKPVYASHKKHCMDISPPSRPVVVRNYQSTFVQPNYGGTMVPSYIPRTVPSNSQETTSSLFSSPPNRSSYGGYYSTPTTSVPNIYPSRHVKINIGNSSSQLSYGMQRHEENCENGVQTTCGYKVYLLFKILLLLTNTIIGIWSLQHLYSQSNDTTKSSLIVFAVFFTLQLLANILVVIWEECYPDGFIRIGQLLVVILLVLPMLGSQAYAAQNVNPIVWSVWYWDVVLQIVFIVITILILIGDACVYIYVKMKEDREINECLCCLLCLVIVVYPVLLFLILIQPVYICQFGWDWVPYVGDISNHDSGTENLLIFILVTGAMGLWLWTVALPLAFMCCVCCYLTCS